MFTHQPALILAEPQCPESVIAAGAPPRPLVPHLLSAAAAAPLPRSPVPGRQVGMTAPLLLHLTGGCCSTHAT